MCLRPVNSWSKSISEELFSKDAHRLGEQKFPQFPMDTELRLELVYNDKILTLGVWTVLL